MTDLIVKGEGEQNNLSFEDFKQEKEGMTFWWASTLMGMLGYKDMKSFGKVIDRATKACISLNIPHYENFVAEMNEKNGELIQDFKLTRFACYLAVMNGDPKKMEVATAQVYFVEQTRKYEVYLQSHEDIDRLQIRDELTEGTKSLNSTAKGAGVNDYARFTNAGYLGLYNMTKWQLTGKRRLKKNANIQDFMGRTELAANLFRVTQTEEKIKSKNVRGQSNLEQTHYQVGKEVRDIVMKNTGKRPENLPIEKRIPEVKKELKQGYRKMIKEDNTKKKNI